MSSEPHHPAPDDVAPPADRDEPRARRDEPDVSHSRHDEPDVSRSRRDGPDVSRDRRDGPDAGETRGGRLAEDRPENRRREGDGRDTGLVDPDRARDYRSRWEKVKGGFVDEPRRAVQDANALVGEVLDDVEAMFRNQREHLERELDDADLSTEDMRLALGRYRTFFDRLLDL